MSSRSSKKSSPVNGVVIRLPRGEWVYDPSRPLGPPGGFGRVYQGRGQGFPDVAVKKLHIDAEQAAHRELRIAAELADREMEHVLPFLDAGQDSESEGYFVVMPRADRSLLDALRANGPLREVEAAGVLHQIVSGLLEGPDLVHRDLKPGNVLEHQAKWKD